MCAMLCSRPLPPVAMSDNLAAMSTAFNKDILESRGYFWLADQDIPPGRLGPDGAIAGRLRTRADGVSELELDAVLRTGGFLSRMVGRGAVETPIAGILHDGAQHVLLTDIAGNGGSLGFKGPSREQLLAYRCLVSGEAIDPKARFRWLELPLDGFEEWIGAGGIAAKDGKRAVTASYPKSRPSRWRADGMTVELTRFIRGSAGDRLTAVEWRELSLLRLGFGQAGLTVDRSVDLAARIEDLLVLLSDCNRALDFPRLRTKRGGPAVRLMFARNGRSTTEAAKRHKCWVPYAAVREIFGSIVATWLAAHNEHGPSLHLYLGNRRGQAMYWEHRFASLIWGLETLHRSFVPVATNTALERKIKRILAQIEPGKDQDWAAWVFARSAEPRLASRLEQLVLRLPMDFDPASLKAFTGRCAARRNDLSHFGGARQVGDYDAFIEEIAPLSAAVDLIYHALLLQIASVPDPIIAHYFLRGLSSHGAQRTLSDAGLLLDASARADS